MAEYVPLGDGRRPRAACCAFGAALSSGVAGLPGSWSPTWRPACLDLRERDARGADANGDPVAGLQLRGADHGRHVALPEQEDRVVVVGERLVERLAEHRAERPPVAARHMQRDVATRLRAGDGADVEPQRQRRVGLMNAVADDAGGLRLEIGQRRAGAVTHVDVDPVARLQVGVAPDGRNALAPDRGSRCRADRERLVLALPEHRAQGRAVAALDRELHGRRRSLRSVRRGTGRAAAAGVRCTRRARGDGGAGEQCKCEDDRGTAFHRGTSWKSHGLRAHHHPVPPAVLSCVRKEHAKRDI